MLEASHYSASEHHYLAAARHVAAAYRHLQSNGPHDRKCNGEATTDVGSRSGGTVHQRAASIIRKRVSQ